MARKFPTESLIRSKFQYFPKVLPVLRCTLNMFEVFPNLSLESILESLAKSVASLEKSLGSDPMLDSHQDSF